MRNGTLLLLIVLTTTANTRAEGIHYEQIPADASGYFHLDVGRLLSSGLLQQCVGAADELPKFSAIFGTHSGVTIYTPKGAAGDGYVVLWHCGDPQVRQRVEAALGKISDAVVVSYGSQTIHYSSLSLSHFWSMPDDKAPSAATQAAKDVEPPIEKTSSSISIGLGQGGRGLDFSKGPCYTTVIGQDLIVVAGDLPSIANAIDVMQGKKPSLAQQDPQKLKVEAPRGVMVLGAGLTAGFYKKNTDKPDKHAANEIDGARVTPKDDGDKGFGLDLFGSVRANAELARIDMGEDDKQIYVDGLLAMKDAKSSEQLKNLVIGLKAADLPFAGERQAAARSAGNSLGGSECGVALVVADGEHCRAVSTAGRGAEQS